MAKNKPDVIQFAMGRAYRDAAANLGGVTVGDAILGLAMTREALLRSFALSSGCELDVLREMLDAADIYARRLADENMQSGNYKIFSPTERIPE